MSRIVRIILLLVVAFPLAVRGAEVFAPQGETPGVHSPGTPGMTAALTQDEAILIQASSTKPAIQHQVYSYFIKTGGALALYDSEFKDFLDYGVSVSLGAKRQLSEKVSLLAALDLALLTGEWDTGSNRERIILEAETYIPGFPGEVSPEDVNPGDIPGIGYTGEGEAMITSSQLLKSLDLDTTLYIVPLTFSLLYEFNGGRKERISPYVGGGVGFCAARREVESRAVKEQSFQGAQYRITLDDDETVFGQMVQLFAGIKIPFKDRFSLVAEASATMFDLDKFDPVLEISADRDDPNIQDDTTLSPSYETPMKIGVFEQELVTSFSIGVVVPF